VRIAFALLLAVGCASPMAAVKADNRRLAQTVAELRAERRAQERRLRDLQRQLDLARAQLVTAGVDGSMPPLRVEVAGPAPGAGAAPAAGAAPGAAPPGASGSRVVGVADDGAEIVYEGDAAAGKPAMLADDPPSAPRPRPTREPSRARAPDPRGGDAGNEYRAAVELVKAGSHAALRAFLAKHPRHEFADNAQYWLGEAYYAQKDYPSALAEFRGVIESYPRGNKVPDAMLKMGYCYLALGQKERSRAVLEQVVNRYPKTEPAATAAKRLESL